MTIFLLTLLLYSRLKSTRTQWRHGERETRLLMVPVHGLSQQISYESKCRPVVLKVVVPIRPDSLSQWVQLQRLIRVVWDETWTPESFKYPLRRWFWCVDKSEHRWQGARIHLNKHNHQGGFSPSFLKKFPERAAMESSLFFSFSLCAPTLCGKYYPTFWETHYFIQNNGCEPCFASIMPLPAPACLLSEPLTGHLKPSISKVSIFYVAWHHQTKMIPPKKTF